jgi:hypothetical protein
MDRQDKIKLINQLEIGAIPIEMFQPPRITFKILETNYIRSSRKVSHDEDHLGVVKTHFGINPYTGNFYGEIIIYIVK